MRSLAIVVALSACSASSRRTAPPASEAPMVPVTAAIDVVSGEPTAGGRMGFRARLERHGVWTAPISVEFQVPRGAVVVGGKTQTVMAGDGEPLGVELQLGEVPADDLVLVARSTTEGAGFTAKAFYRFGRPDPVKTGPDKSGPSFTSPSGVDLGPSVPVK